MKTLLTTTASIMLMSGAAFADGMPAEFETSANASYEMANDSTATMNTDTRADTATYGTGADANVATTNDARANAEMRTDTNVRAGDSVDTAVRNADPFTVEDDTIVELSGTVEAIDGDDFTLNYGNGRIVVETSEWLATDDIHAQEDLRVGQELTVIGNVDDDILEGRELEAHEISSMAR